MGFWLSLLKNKVKSRFIKLPKLEREDIISISVESGMLGRHQSITEENEIRRFMGIFNSLKPGWSRIGKSVLEISMNIRLKSGVDITLWPLGDKEYSVKIWIERENESVFSNTVSRELCDYLNTAYSAFMENPEPSTPKKKTGRTAAFQRGKNKTKGGDFETRFFSTWEDDRDDEAFLQTHCIDKDTFMFFREVQEGGVEAGISDGRIVRVCDFEYDHETETYNKHILEEELDIKVPDLKENRAFFLKKTAGGRHIIGGEIPEELTLPVYSEFKTPFQYIGTLDCSDTAFEWIGIPKLHIVFPVYECISGIFLDYSDPVSPKVLKLKQDWHSNEWYKSTGMVGNAAYSKVEYSIEKAIIPEEYMNGCNLILCGVPMWYQWTDVPRCPKTGQVMRFVCSINSDSDNKILNSREAFPEMKYPPDYMCFGDAEHLFIFFDPKSRVLYAVTQ